MATVKNYEAACKKLKKDPIKSLPYPTPADKDEEAYNALRMLEIMILASNSKGWVADYGNRNQKKWYIWFIWDASVSAFRFNDTGYGYTDAPSSTGARLAMETEEIAEAIGKDHIDLWNKWLTK
jgi:hypothetical protein